MKDSLWKMLGDALSGVGGSWRHRPSELGKFPSLRKHAIPLPCGKWELAKENMGETVGVPLRCCFLAPGRAERF